MNNTNFSIRQREAIERMKEMNDELRGTMASTGVADTSSFDPTVIYRLSEAK